MSHETTGHHVSMDHGAVHQHSYQHELHATHDDHGMNQQHPYQASHYDYNDGGHHLSTDSLTGHHSSSGTMKRSQSVPIIPVLEAIHFDHIQPYTPHNETLMEREVKIVREREEALRMARGLGPLVSDVLHEIEVATPRPRIEDQHNPEELSRKYAENRLRTELQREKQREVDLLMLGKIQSLSEHRKGDMEKYVEKVSSDTEELREFARSKSTVHREISSDHSLLSPTSKASHDFEHRTVVTNTHAPKTNLHVEIQGHKGSFVNEGKGHHAATSHAQPHFSVSSPKSMEHPPAMRVHTLVRTSSDDGTTHQHSTRSTAEKRIELEVAEAKRRENELRELRKSMLLQLGGEHSHEVKHSNETHHNANALEKNHGHATGTLETHHGHKAGTLDTHHGHTTGALDTHHGHKTGTLETHHVHTTVEVRSESLDHGHGKAVKVSLHREGSDDSGERSPGSPTPGRLALVGDWERKITRSSSP